MGSGVMLVWFLSSTAVVVALIAAATDLRSGRIPNRLTFSAMLIGLAVHGIGDGIAGVVASLGAITLCVAVPGIVYKSSQGCAIGGGDIKLFAAIGALLGPMQGLEVELSAFLLVGTFALFRLAFLGQLGRTLVGSLRAMAGLLIPGMRQREPGGGVPAMAIRMGPAILLGVGSVLGLPHLMRWFPWLG
jgi:prepilin peptidase CpaA